MPSFVDLTGKTFGRLKVIKLEKKIKEHYFWFCECECGNTKISRGSSLRKGVLNSCGCIKRTNKFEINGNYVIGLTIKNDKFIFDVEDLEKVKRYTWHKNSEGYFQCCDANRKCIKLHRYLINAKDGYVDHKNHDLSDNRKENLRLCDGSESCMNRGLPKNNKSGVRGVHWDKKAEKWVAVIGIHYMRIVLGYFKIDELEKAKECRLNAEKFYHKEFSYDPIKDIRNVAK